AVRLLLLGLMLVSLLMSAALPQAFGEHGLLFAGALSAMHIGRYLFTLLALGSVPVLRRNFQRILIWAAASAVLWLAGGFAHGSARDAFWVIAVAIDTTAPAAGYYVPGLGRSRTTDWAIAGAHLAERCQLFLLIALGESILVTGATLGGLAITPAAVAAFVAAFLTSATMSWIYFARTAAAAGGIIAHAAAPGGLGRSAYPYSPTPMVAGTIVPAAGDGRAIAPPTEPSTAGAALTILGGPALFLAGHMLFKQASFG